MPRRGTDLDVRPSPAMLRYHPTIRTALFVTLLTTGAKGMAQRALDDSLAGVANRIATQLMDSGRPRVTLVGIDDPGGEFDPAQVTYIEELLIMHLTTVGNGLVVLERRGLDQVLEEQKRTASGNFDERSAIELGRLLAADAIITGSMYRVDKQLHLLFRLLDTGTGILLGSAETITALPKGEGNSVRSAEPTVMRPPGPINEEIPDGHLELRVTVAGANYFDRNILGGSFEASLRSLDTYGGRHGHVSIGLQFSIWSSPGSWGNLPYDIGHITDLRTFGTTLAEPTVRLGNVDLRQNDLFMVTTTDPVLAYQPRAVNGLGGMEMLEWQRHRITNIRTGMFGLNLPLRFYFGRGLAERPRFFTELGFGMDFVVVQANYEVTSTLVQYDMGEEDYVTNTSTYSTSKPMSGDVSRDIFLTHMSFGAGIEFGRFQVFAQGRFMLSTHFSDLGRGYDRVRGNILAYPTLAGASTDGRTLTDLEQDGVVLFGATDLEHVRATDGTGEGITVNGNGVFRYWDDRQYIIGLSFRLR